MNKKILGLIVIFTGTLTALTSCGIGSLPLMGAGGAVTLVGINYMVTL